MINPTGSEQEDRQPSRFVLRLPRFLDQALEAMAHDNGVSKNTMIVCLLAEQIGRKGKKQ